MSEARAVAAANQSYKLTAALAMPGACFPTGPSLSSCRSFHGMDRLRRNVQFHFEMSSLFAILFL
jgi:hypothetical protein